MLPVPKTTSSGFQCFRRYNAVLHSEAQFDLNLQSDPIVPAFSHNRYPLICCNRKMHKPLCRSHFPELHRMMLHCFEDIDIKGIFSVKLLLHSQQRYLCPIQNNDNGIPGYSGMSFNVISKESCIYTFPPHSGHITSLVFLVLLKHTTALSFVGLNDICLASNP